MARRPISRLALKAFGTLVLAGLPASTLPIYVGDDVTDESAFTALKRGVTIRVGLPRRTRARFRLRNPLEVWEFLRRLEKEIP